MSLPDANGEMSRLQADYYRSVGRAARLWHTLTVIKLVLGLLFVIGLCVGAILSAGSLTLIYQNLIQGVPINGY